MRLSTRSSLVLLAAYLLLLGATAVWMERELRSRSAGMLKRTERLLGREVAAALSGPAVQQILDNDPVATARLREIVDQVTQRSQMVTEVVVVDGSGRVIAGEGAETGRQLTIPQLVFDSGKHTRFLSSRNPLRPDESYLFVGLKEHDQLIGYLRLALHSEPIAQLYGLARRQLAVAGGIGLLVVALLGVLIHLQFSRVSGQITHALESAARGETFDAGPRDEFRDAFDAAQKAGAELRAARERSTQADHTLRSLTEMLDVGVLLVRRDATLDFASPRARELLGCAGAEDFERRWPELRSVLADRLANGAAVDKPPIDLEIDSDGGPTRLRLEVRALGTDSEPLLVFVKDRDALEGIERELRLAVQMRGFARFYMAFAHDLKAPLNAMALNLELLNLSLRDGDGESQITDQQKRCLEVLKNEIFRLDRDLRTLLHHVAPPSDTTAEFDLRDVIADLTSLLQPQGRKQRVQLDMQVPEAAVPMHGHRDRLKQAMLNIAINALEAMPEGGQLTIALERDADDARIRVQDTGPGIPPEILEKIYEMNFTTKQAGSGIGLYVARSVVESHGGRIHVESESGRGTRFEIELPTLRAAA